MSTAGRHRASRAGSPIRYGGVWRAVSTYDELAAWFVAPMEFTTRTAVAMEAPGEVARYDPPTALELGMGRRALLVRARARWDGTPSTFPPHLRAGRARRGLRQAGTSTSTPSEAHLDRQPPGDADPQHLVELNDRYAERFGLDREASAGATSTSITARRAIEADAATGPGASP